MRRKKAAKSNPKRKPEKTPIRRAIKIGSNLQSWVKNGLSAIKRNELGILDSSIRTEFLDSLDLDEATRVCRENENRWDYLLGHRTSKKVIALEPHSATNGEISVVIKKKKAAQEVLRDHINGGIFVYSWNWVSSGIVGFSPLDKAKLQLDQHGITFVGRKLLRKHLPQA